MPQCKAMTKAGSQCKAAVVKGSKFCLFHGQMRKDIRKLQHYIDRRTRRY